MRLIISYASGRSVCSGARTRFSFIWQGLSADQILSVGPATVASSLNKHATYIWDGDIRLTVEKISGRDKKGQFEIGGMESNYILSVNDDQRTLSGEALLSIDRLNAKSLNVGEASVCFATKGLDINGYEAFM